MNGRKSLKKRYKRDPEYYSTIRRKRVNYPKNEGMFTSEKASQLAKKRWDRAKAGNED